MAVKDKCKFVLRKRGISRLAYAIILTYLTLIVIIQAACRTFFWQELDSVFFNPYCIKTVLIQILHLIQTYWQSYTLICLFAEIDI